MLGKIIKLVIYFSSCFHSLIIFFRLVVLAEKGIDDGKRDTDTFKLNFYSHVYNYFVERNVVAANMLTRNNGTF